MSTAPLTSRCCILHIYSTSIRTEYFKRAAHSPFFSLQNAVHFIMLPFWFLCYSYFIYRVCYNLKKNSGTKGLKTYSDAACLQGFDWYRVFKKSRDAPRYYRFIDYVLYVVLYWTFGMVSMHPETLPVSLRFTVYYSHFAARSGAETLGVPRKAKAVTLAPVQDTNTN